MADRSVSISLRARVGDYLVGMRQAKAETTNLGRQMTETGASADHMRRRLEAATKALPKIKIDADSSEAERRFAELRRELESLSGKKIGIDVSAAEAHAEIQRIERELQQLQMNEADINVRADIGQALTELRAVDREVSKVDGRTAKVNVNADVGGALANIALVAAALASLPAATSIAVGVGALGAAFTAAGVGAAGFAAVAIPSLGRVNEALQQQESSAGGAGGATESLAQKQAKAAATSLQLAQAQDRVRDAHAAVRQAQEQVTAAVEQAAERQASATRRVEDSERAVADAHRATQRALEDLSRAREDARERLEDLALATERGALSEERAQLNILRAQADLAKSNADPKASGLDRQDAALRVKEAQLALKEIKERNGDLAKEQADANAKGIEGSDQVRRAKEGVESATRREQDAERDLKDARSESARVAIEGQKSIAKAQAAVIKAQRDAERAAQQLKVQQLQAKAAMEKTGGAAGGAASKMSQLSKAEQDLAKDIQGFQKKYEDWQKSLEGDVFPAISGGLDLVSSQLPRISPLVRTAGRSFLDLEKDAKAALKAPFWGEFFYDMNTAMPNAITSLGHTAGNTFKGIAGVLDALLPHADGVVDSLEAGSKKFADWGTTLKNNPDFKAFIAYAEENGPKVKEIFLNIAEAVGKIVKAGGEIGPQALDLLVIISEKIANLEPDQIQAIALGIGGIMAAAKLGTTLKLGAFALLADILDGMSPGQIKALALAIGAVVLAVKGFQAFNTVSDLLGTFRGKISDVGEAAGKARGKISGLTDKLGGLGGSVASGAILTAGLFILEQRFNDAALAADRFTEKVLAGAGGDLDQQIAAVNKELQHQLDLQGPNIGEWLYFTQTGKEAGDKVDALRDRLDELNHQKELATIRAKTAGDAIGTMGGKVNGATGAVDGLNKSLNNFTSSTDFAQMIETLKGKYDDLRGAIKDANGTLDISKAKTNEQRDAIITAREKFSGYIDSVREMAEKQQTLTGRTGDAKKAVLDQVGALLTLAGKSRDAQDLVYGLAQKFGITRDEADKAKGKIDGVKGALDKLRDKTVKVMADTSKAESAIKTLINKFNGYKIVTQVDTKTGRSYTTTVKEADGGVVEYYAGGGLREAHVAQIAPAGAMRVFAEPESGGEAYIPLAASKRARSLDILATVADMFGQQLVPASGGKHVTVGGTTSVPATGSGTGVVEVDLNNLDSLTLATGYTAKVVTKAVGDAGTATAEAADQVGSAIEQAGGDLAGQMSTLSGSIDRLASSVDGLASSVSSAASAASAAASSAGSSASSKTSSSGKPGTVAPSAPTKKTTSSSSSSKAKTGTVTGSLKAMGSASGSLKQVTSAKPVVIKPAAMADGGLVSSPTILVGEAGREVVVPIDRRARGRETLHQAADMLGYSVVPGLNGPRYSTGGGGFGQLVATLDERSIRRLEAIVAKARGVTVHSNTYYPVPEPTSTKTNRDLQFVGSLGLD
ncbi:hypothetical protein [Microbispora sp. CA-102843]|uniref:hypothetical protein n=1 Tax=Microbispora sp. CA-102843 TaxID=3239952 RepID=UPI003D939A8F